MNSDQIDNLLHKVISIGGGITATNGGTVPQNTHDAIVQIVGALVCLAGVWLSHRHNATTPTPGAK